MRKLKLLDLFSGIGGFSLGLERTGGFQTVAFCEIEPFPRKILNKHWPEVPQYEDIRDLTASRLAADGINRVEAISAGFPCQDISAAGKRRELKARVPAFGAKSSVLLANYDRASSSWKTQQSCLIEGLATFSENWPRGGMMQSGSAYPQQALERPTVGIGSGLLHTPTKTANQTAPNLLKAMYVPTPNAGSSHWGGSWRELGGSGNPLRGTEFGTLKIHPWEWEWMMAYPRDWTGCALLGTA